MTTPTEREKDRIRAVTGLLHQACKPIRILRALAWAPEVKEAFLAGGGRELPQVTYPAFRPHAQHRGGARGPPPDRALYDHRPLAGPSCPVHRTRGADAGGGGHPQLLRVRAPTLWRANGALALCRRSRPSIWRKASWTPLTNLAHIEISTAPPAYHSAEEVAADLDRAVRAHFGDQAPAIELVDRLSANALATSRAIRVRRGARFTDRDFTQLLHHEAFIHVATSLNGKAQTDLPLLAAGHPGTTRTQEGLAVFAEVISGSIELDRLRRLADRVLAIQMAIEGADFLEVYRFYPGAHRRSRIRRSKIPGGSFAAGSSRAARPSTKDLVYLLGLLQVNNFIRASFAAGRADCLSLLFCGKLDIFDIPALCELYAMGLCRPPRFLPPWISDPRHLLAMLTFSVFTSRMNLETDRRGGAQAAGQRAHGADARARGGFLITRKTRGKPETKMPTLDKKLPV